MLQRSQFFWLVAACLLSTLVSGQEATESLAEAPAQEAVMFEVRELDPMATVTDNMSVVSGAAAPVEERAPQEQIPEQPLEQLPETTTCDTPAPSSRLEILLVPGLVLLNTYDLLHIGEGEEKGRTE